MKVGVLLFAGAREAVGGKTLQIALPPGSPVGPVAPVVPRGPRCPHGPPWAPWSALLARRRCPPLSFLFGVTRWDYFIYTYYIYIYIYIYNINI